ncbi:MAG: hypothetical protein QUS33_09120 [Dehalococcoidia bacterium]|nr:hypothetical protein [Dehalococcoidia bacterium]
MSLEDRFKNFAREQQDVGGQRRGPYEKNLESLAKVDAMVSRVLEAFCQAVGWSLKRNDCCDKEKGAVSCNYILEHPEFWREGFVAVDIEVTWGHHSDPVDAVTVYQGEIRGAAEHVRSHASRIVIPFDKLTEDSLADALEHQSANVIKRISLRQRTE